MRLVPILELVAAHERAAVLNLDGVKAPRDRLPDPARETPMSIGASLVSETRLVRGCSVEGVPDDAGEERVALRVSHSYRIEWP